MKNKYLVALILIVILPVFVASQEMGFEEYDPVSTLVVPATEVKRAKFPFIDVHSHQRDMSADGLKIVGERHGRFK